MANLLWLLGIIFWMVMIYDCVRNDPEKNTWLWLLIFLNILGAIIYFLVRRLPYLNLPIPPYFQRWFRRQQIWDAEAAAMNIGKAHQYIILGNLLADVQLWERATEAYQTALQKEENNQQALWGIASIAKKQDDLVAAKQYLEKLLKLNSEYQYGDAILLYSKVLFELKDSENAKINLEQTIKNWRKPEAYILLSKIQIEQGYLDVARNNLETVLRKLRGSPQYHYRRNQNLVTEANKMLKKLRRNN